MASEKERLLLEQGPFPGRMDVWAEHSRFFHRLHEQMIGVIVAALTEPLFTLGYYIARGTTMRIGSGGVLDGYIDTPRFRLPNGATYDLAARELLLEPGIAIEAADPETALSIYHADTNALITIVELVSPNNKIHDGEIFTYQARRHSQLISQGVNVVEVDITRSRKRLTVNEITMATPYHTALFIAGEGLRVIPMAFHQAFPSFALPVYEHVIPLPLHAIYETSYRNLLLASALRKNQIYTLEHLPCPSLLTDAERDEALAAVAAWEAALQEAKQA